MGCSGAPVPFSQRVPPWDALGVPPWDAEDACPTEPGVPLLGAGEGGGGSLPWCPSPGTPPRHRQPTQLHETGQEDPEGDLEGDADVGVVDAQDGKGFAGLGVPLARTVGRLLVQRMDLLGGGGGRGGKAPHLPPP